MFQLRDESEDEETDLQSKENKLSNRHSNEFPNRKRNLILYHLINDFSNDLIYGCSLSTALAHDLLIGSVLSLMIFSEGFRRHSRRTSNQIFTLKIKDYFLFRNYLIIRSKTWSLFSFNLHIFPSNRLYSGWNNYRNKSKI